MPALVSIVGQSESGKTTLITKLIPELKRRGYKLGVIKHAHCRVDMDQSGKDSWRHRQAGADAVIAASPDSLSLVATRNQDNLESLLPYLKDMDLVITEGFKRGKQPKIEAFRQSIHQKPMCLEDPNLIGIITDAAFDTQLPVLDINDPMAVADFIENRFLKSTQ